MPEKIICLMGPTASGKTGLAMEWVHRFPFEIVSVDSAMVYREMNIGTAKPSPEELSQAPHHLIDLIDPPEAFSCAQFCDEVRRVCGEINARGRIPLLTGGTMMYFNALQQGLSDLPSANEDIRRELVNKASEKGWAFLYDELKSKDPAYAMQIHANDKQRTQRALEVFYITGQPMSELLKAEKKQSAETWINLCLMPNNRAWLHDRIFQRFQQMLDAGFVGEVEYLLEKWPELSGSPALRTVGYRQAHEYLSGLYDFEQFKARGVAATRQLAKRQLTWLRPWPQSRVFACDEAGYERKIVAMIEEILDNSGIA